MQDPDQIDTNPIASATYKTPTGGYSRHATLEAAAAHVKPDQDVTAEGDRFLVWASGGDDNAEPVAEIRIRDGAGEPLECTAYTWWSYVNIPLFVTEVK